jgi:hypothetical protein
LNIKEELKPEGDPDVQFNKFERKDENGMIVSRDDPIKGKKVEWPEFEKRGSSMTARQASRALEQFFADPKEAVSYYCGLMKSILGTYVLCILASNLISKNSPTSMSSSPISERRIQQQQCIKRMIGLDLSTSDS